MSRDWRLYLADIRTACDKVLRFTAGMERSAFFADERTYHAVVHCLLIVVRRPRESPTRRGSVSPKSNGERTPGCATGWRMCTSRSTTASSGMSSRTRSPSCSIVSRH